jgi:hypothetical protein
MDPHHASGQSKVDSEHIRELNVLHLLPICALFTRKAYVSCDTVQCCFLLRYLSVLYTDTGYSKEGLRDDQHKTETIIHIMIFRAMKSCSIFNSFLAIYYGYLYIVTTCPTRFTHELISSVDKAHTTTREKRRN